MLRLKGCFPCSSEVYWHGDERDRTGTDAQTTWCQVKFHYEPSSMWNSHGIRLQFNGYNDKDIGEARIDTERWNAIMDNCVKGSEIGKNMAEAYAAGAGK